MVQAIVSQAILNNRLFFDREVTFFLANRNQIPFIHQKFRHFMACLIFILIGSCL